MILTFVEFVRDMINSLIESYFLVNIDLDVLLSFIGSLPTYWDNFLHLIHPITYFIPWQHLRVLLVISITTLFLRIIMALYNVFPFKSS